MRVCADPGDSPAFWIGQWVTGFPLLFAIKSG
jgi:hypothetical protein